MGDFGVDEISFWDSMFLWRDPMIASTVGSVLLAYLGFYVVLTRSAFVSAAVSQLAGLGVVAALFVHELGGPETSPLVAGVALGTLGSTLFLLPRRTVRTSNDAMLAVVVIGASACTMVLAGFLTTEYQHVSAALYGDAVVADEAELLTLGVTAAGLLLVHALFRDRFVLVAFDPASARAQGMSTRPWAFGLGLSLGLAIALVTRSLGALPAFCFTVVPASAALLLSDRLAVARGLAMTMAAIAATLGYYLSFMHDLPTGPTMVAVAVAFLAPGAMRAALRR